MINTAQINQNCVAVIILVDVDEINKPCSYMLKPKIIKTYGNLQYNKDIDCDFQFPQYIYAMGHLSLRIIHTSEDADCEVRVFLKVYDAAFPGNNPHLIRAINVSNYVLRILIVIRDEC